LALAAALVHKSADGRGAAKAFHYPGLDALKAHVLAFVRAYNFAKHLKALRWRTPFQAICDAWAKDRSMFKIDPHHLIPGPNT
jgi:hypothetical protein